MFELLDQHQVDLVLLDLFLDDHGVDVCRELRSKFSVPIIIISSMSGDLNMVQGLEAGADMYLEKPFSVPVLIASINSVLRRVDIDIGQYSLPVDTDSGGPDDILIKSKKSRI